MPGAPPSAGTTRPESSASAGNPLASAAARAFSAALASKLSPISSGSGRPSAPAATTPIANGASNAAISTTLPWLWLAMTSRLASKRGGISSAEAERRTLPPGQFGNAGARQKQHLGEQRLVERGALGRRLNLDDPAPAGQHEIG